MFLIVRRLLSGPFVPCWLGSPANLLTLWCWWASPGPLPACVPSPGTAAGLCAEPELWSQTGPEGNRDCLPELPLT